MIRLRLEVARRRAGVQWKLRNHCAARGNHRVGQSTIALWIKLFQAGAEYTDGLPADVQRCLMGSRIDTQRQPTGDDETGPGEAAGKRGGGIHSRT